MFRGAASRIILAHLPAAVLARLHARHAAEISAAGLGATLPAMRDALREMRTRGWDVTEGQVTQGVTGIAAPVLAGGNEILGSLSVTIGRTGLAEAELARIADKVAFSAGIITRALTANPAY
jgi:DNA-binding IclR family transcriptional regulator